MSEAECKTAIDDIAKRLTIVFPDYPDFGNSFKAHCIEEGYDELDVLLDDFGDGFEESGILEDLSDELDFKDADKEKICTVIHNTLYNFRKIPTALNIKDIHININKVEQELDEMKQLVLAQAHKLVDENNPSEDKALLSVLIIGKQNYFPLLIYLVDTYARWKLNKYHKLYNELHKYDMQNQRQQFIGQYFKLLTVQDFFKDCYIMKILNQEAKNDIKLNTILLWYEHSISSFYRRITMLIRPHPKAIEYVVNDALILYVKYTIALLYSINNIIRNPTSKLPLQIDFWIIPKSMSKNNHYNFDDSDDEDDSDSNDDEKGDDKKEQCDLKDFTDRLKWTDKLDRRDLDVKEIYNLSRVFVNIYQKVTEYKRNKRMVMIIDRRVDKGNMIDNDNNYAWVNMEEERTKADKLYAFLPKNSQNIPAGQYLHESMFNLTRMEILPSDNGKIGKNLNTVHSNSDMKNMFLLSIHVHQIDNIRAYWYVNGTVSRFFINDMINIWPLYFREKLIDKKNGVAILQDIDPIIRFVNDNIQNMPLKDADFDTFFQANTGVNPANCYAKSMSPNNKK